MYNVKTEALLQILTMKKMLVQLNSSWISCPSYMKRYWRRNSHEVNSPRVYQPSFHNIGCYGDTGGKRNINCKFFLVQRFKRLMKDSFSKCVSILTVWCAFNNELSKFAWKPDFDLFQNRLGKNYACMENKPSTKLIEKQTKNQTIYDF